MKDHASAECCELHRAISHANSDAVTRLMRKRWLWLGPSRELLSHGNREGNTVLSALVGGNLCWGGACKDSIYPLFPMQILILLLDRGADPNIMNRDERNAFHEAAGYCCYSRRDRGVLDRWVDKKSYPRKWQIFIFEILWRKYNGAIPKAALVLELLAHAGADINHLDRKQQNPLHYACRKHSNPSVIRCLLKLGVDPSAKDWQGKYPEDLAQPIARDLIIQHRQAGRPST